MQVRTSRPPGGAGERDNVPCLHGLSYLGQQAGVVTIERREAIPMVDHHIVTIAACIILGDCHRTGKGRSEERFSRNAETDLSVLARMPSSA